VVVVVGAVVVVVVGAAVVAVIGALSETRRSVTATRLGSPSIVLRPQVGATSTKDTATATATKKGLERRRGDSWRGRARHLRT
jgi:hypothetical protein